VRAQGDAIGPRPVSLSLRSDIAADIAQQQAAVSGLQIDTMGINVSGDAQVQQFMETPTYKTNIAVTSFNPRDVLSKLKIDLPVMAEKNALTNVALKLQASGDISNANVQSLQVKMDETTIQGNATVKNFAQPAIVFAMDVDKVDVDRYLPPKTSAKQQQPAPASAGRAAPEQPLPVPVELLRSLKLDGHIRIQEFTVMQLANRDVNIGIKAKQGHIDVKPVSLKVANGTIEHAIALDVSKQQPHYALQQTITSVNAGPIVKAIMDDDLISGTLNLTANITTQGLLISEIIKQLNGDLKFHFADGAVKGFNLGEMIRKVQAKLKGEDYKSADVPMTTDFAELSGSATIKDGVVTNKDLSAKSPLLRVSGDGKVDLVRNSMNYLATAYVVGTAQGQGGKELDELKGLPIPIRIKGTFDKLDYGVDYGPIRKA